MQSVFVPIVTPFNPQGYVYEKGIRGILGYLHEKGIRGVWLLGSYGSFPLMSIEERMRTTETVVPLARRFSMSCIVNISHPATDAAIKLARHAERAGADGLASVVPYYYASSHYSEHNIVAYFKEILNNANIPLIFYNNARTTGYTPSVTLIQKLLECGVKGLKDTADYVNMWERINILQTVRPEGVYLAGTTRIYLQGYLLGAHGVVSGTALAVPEMVLKLRDALMQNEMSEAVRLQALLLKVRCIQGRYVGRAVSCYDLLEAKGVDAGTCKSPWLRMTRAQAMEVIDEIRILEGEV